jgi:cyclophilin family peptidyl-prolyl cis-trans isomerase
MVSMRVPVVVATLVVMAGSAWPQPPAELEAVVTTSEGTFRFEFAPDKAPRHVDQFIAWARQGYYDGGAFHRVIANALIQGGDPLLKNPQTPRNLWGTGGLNLQKDEFSDLHHDRGVVSTVRLPGKADSDGAQFFVCTSPQKTLDGQFSAFGRVTEGMDVVDRISRVPADSNANATMPVRILKITIEKKKVQPFLDAPVSELRKTVTLKTTLGSIKIRMNPDWAPENVRNFLALVSTGWYNGTAFHRVIKGFVAQGGDASTRASGPIHAADRWVHPVKGEFHDDVKHVRGVISMAHGDDPNSASTSFFLVLGDASNLDGKFSAFGTVVDGMDVLDAFEKEEFNGEAPKRRIELIEATID